MPQPMETDPTSPTSPENSKPTTLNQQSDDAITASDRSSPAASDNSRNHKESQNYERDLANLNAVLASTSPAAIRAGIRQNWRKCLLGSSSDESFFIRNLLKRTSDHVVSNILENSHERILEVANEHYKGFLDLAMEIRLESISATDLVAALAASKRLGYEEMDLVGSDEMVVPAENSETNGLSDMDEGEEKLQVEIPEILEVESAISKDDWAKEKQREFRMRQQNDVRQEPMMAVDQTRERIKGKSKRKECPACGATFLQAAGLKYHMDRKVCERQRPTGPLKFWCEFCSKGFTTSGGLTYHKLNLVCQGIETSPVASPNALRQAERAGKHIAPRWTLTPKATHNSKLYPETSQIHTNSSSRNMPKLPQYYPGFSSNEYAAPVQHQHHVKSGSGTDAAVALTPEQFAEMNAKLEKEEKRFDSVLRKMSENMTPEERKAEIKRLKAGSSTRKSIIRREYGVQVRRSKVAAANAAHTSTGGVDVSMTDAPSSTNSFAAINRTTVFRAAPAKSRDPKESYEAPLPPDAKRRRTGEVDMFGRNPMMYDPLRDIERRHSLDQYPRPNFNGTRLPPPDQEVKSDNRPTTAQRQNGIIPPSRPPLYSDRSSNAAAQHDPHQHPSHPRQQQLPTRGFTSVNVHRNGPVSRDGSISHAAPVARMQDYSAPPFYVDQERGSQRHPSSNGDTVGTFGVLKSTNAPGRDVQGQWETILPTGRVSSGQFGHASRTLNKTKESAQPRSSKPGDIVEILSDTSSDCNTSTSSAANQTAIRAPISRSDMPPEAWQGAGMGGHPTALPATSSQQVSNYAPTAVMDDEELSSDSDGSSDASIPAKRTDAKSPMHRPRGSLSGQLQSTRRGSEAAEAPGKRTSRRVGAERYGKENREF